MHTGTAGAGQRGVTTGCVDVSYRKASYTLITYFEGLGKIPHMRSVYG